MRALIQLFEGFYKYYCHFIVYGKPRRVSPGQLILTRLYENKIRISARLADPTRFETIT